MNACHFKPLCLKKASDTPQHRVIASFEKAQELGKVAKETSIDS
jgi:hypothetical protein